MKKCDRRIRCCDETPGKRYLIVGAALRARAISSVVHRQFSDERDYIRDKADRPGSVELAGCMAVHCIPVTRRGDPCPLDARMRLSSPRRGFHP